jgi:hypothetical protein
LDLRRERRALFLRVVQFKLFDMTCYVAIAIALATVWNYRFNVMLGWRDTAATD